MLSSGYNVIIFFIFLCIISIDNGVNAQERCGINTYNQLINNQSEDEFEQWLQEKIRFQNEQLSILGQHSNTIYEIPVVIHIIHNGEPIGTGINISDAQIASQMEVLNEDFRRLNADKVHTPSIFQHVAADIQVNFILAKRNPEGLATNAIIRKKGSQSSWKENDFKLLKKTSYWASEDYLNIWVADLANGHLGFAQLPQTDKLKGLEGASANAFTDGVIMDYQVFGSSEKYPSAHLKSKFNRGRTLTHEVGHFLGLRHIWGDDNCATDYCDDTPTQRKSTNGCPSHPTNNQCIPSSPKMFQNFMDYTNDACMNLFSQDQKTRMRTVLEHSPRRKSLTTSPAILDPVVHDYDIGLLSMISPSSNTCNAKITPKLLIKNYGKIKINSTKIQLTVNGKLESIINFNIPLISQFSTTSVTFPSTNLKIGTNKLKFEVVSINGQSDEGVHNNLFEYKVFVSPVSRASLSEDFESDLGKFSINNIDGLVTWSILDAPNGSSSNSAIALQYYDYSNIKSEDWLISPVMDFSNLDIAHLLFDYSYAKISGDNNDQLKVVISQDCGVTFQPIFDKSGSSLNTTTQSFIPFIPLNQSDWQSASIDLSAYIGKPKVQLAFVGVNDSGNNLYLDNIELVTTKGVKIRLSSIISPPLISANLSQDIIINVKNTGSETINNLLASYHFPNLPKKEVKITDLSLASGQSKNITVGQFTAKEGIHKLTAEISSPNNDPNAKIITPILEVNYAIDTRKDGVPFKITWDDDYRWTNISRSANGKIWDSQITNYANSMTMSRNNSRKTEKLWYISSSLDLSSSPSPILSLQWAYSPIGNNENPLTSLKVLLIASNGNENIASNLRTIHHKILPTVKESKPNWSPSDTSHWNTQLIELPNYNELKNIRIAIVGTSNSSNNLYVDNIEFYKNKNDINQKIDSKKIIFFPNPIFSSSDAKLHLVFGLEKRQPVAIRILDLTGKVVFSQCEQYALNQTFAYDVSGLSAGILILSVSGSNFQYHSRISVVK